MTRDTGEVTLHLPKLDNEWQWNFKTSPKSDYAGPMLELTVSAERGIWISESGGIYPGSSIMGMPVYLRDSDGYDQIISKVQKAVDDLYERFLDYEGHLKTSADALQHICETFANTDSVTKTLHLYDNGNE